MRKTIFIAILLAAVMPIMAQQSREAVCEACEQTALMTDSTICRSGYGCAQTQAEADSIAMSNARGELVNLLRDSIAAICYKAVRPVMITSYGLVDNENANEIPNQLTMADLFE